MSILRKTFLTLFFLWGCLVAYKARADELKYLAHPQESLSAFVRLAEQSKTSLELSTFIFEPCHASTQVLMDVLAARAKAGVKVRILLDAFMIDQGNRQELANYFAKNGIQVRFYNDTAMVDPGGNLRLHSKVMIVDGAAYISGGRNISDEYFAMSAKQNWVDRDVYVYGSSATQAVKYFNEIWVSDMTKNRKGSGSAFKGWNKYCGTELSKRAPDVRAFIDAKGNDLINRIPSRTCASVKFYNDAPDFGNPKYSDEFGDFNNTPDSYMTPMRMERKRTTKNLLQFIEDTRSQIDLENWGYIPVGYLRNAFSGLRSRNVKVKGIVNRDMESGPKFFQEAQEWAISWISGEDSEGSQSIRLISSLGKLKDSYELTVPKVNFFLHGKVMVRDQRDAVVSSFNLDARSYNTNLESAVMVKNCPEFAADVKREISKVNATYDDDVKSGRVPEKEEAGLFSKIFALMNLNLF